MKLSWQKPLLVANDEPLFDVSQRDFHSQFLSPSLCGPGWQCSASTYGEAHRSGNKEVRNMAAGTGSSGLVSNTNPTTSDSVRLCTWVLHRGPQQCRPCCATQLGGHGGSTHSATGIGSDAIILDEEVDSRSDIASGGRGVLDAETSGRCLRPVTVGRFAPGMGNMPVELDPDVCTELLEMRETAMHSDKDCFILEPALIHCLPTTHWRWVGPIKRHDLLWWPDLLNVLLYQGSAQEKN